MRKWVRVPIYSRSRFTDVQYWVQHALICCDITYPIFHLPGSQLWERLQRCSPRDWVVGWMKLCQKGSPISSQLLAVFLLTKVMVLNSFFHLLAVRNLIKESILWVWSLQLETNLHSQWRVGISRPCYFQYVCTFIPWCLCWLETF